MVTTSTRTLPLLFSVVLFFLLLLGSNQANAQTYKINLTGQPNGIWDSPNVARGGSYCEGDNCIQFEVILDKNAGGLQVDLVSGSEPKGSMGYRLNCGTEVPVGQPICVSGVGPHTITICKPGNSKNVYRIISVAAFNPQPDLTVSGGL